MRPIYEHIELESSGSIKLRRFIQSQIDIPWHFHPEYEIVQFRNGAGKMFIGESVSTFCDGDTVFIGGGVPHFFLKDVSVRETSGNRPKDVNDKDIIDIFVIHFRKDLFGEQMFHAIEFSNIARILQKSVHGIKFPNGRHNEISQKLFDLENMSGIILYTEFLRVLDMMESNSGYQIINSVPDQANIVAGQDLQLPKRIEKVIQYLVNNYNKSIALQDAASLVNMNTTAFCRYFKTHTRKTFTQYLNELRIGYASKLLAAEHMSISEICYEVGYNNLSHFNHTFRHLQKMTPSEYRNSFKIEL